MTNAARPLRALVVEDSEDDYLLATLELEHAGFAVDARRVQTADELKAALREKTWDVVLSDFSMPTFGGMEALATVLSSEQAAVPFIILSGSIGEVRAVEALKAGAANYVMKGHVKKLVPVIERELKDARMRRERADAVEALRQAVRVRDDFLSIASHELKTPLTTVQLQVQGLRRALAAEADGTTAAPLGRDRLDARLALMERGSRRLGDLVDRLLAITRVASGQLVLQREPMELGALVHEVIAELGAQLGEGGIEISAACDAPARGDWDRSHLHTVVANLLTNAAKYGAGRPVRVTVETAGGEAHLRVEDEGIGIAPPDQRRIFERFERAVPPDQYGGFGLGLWWTRQAVEAHGGTIAVTSALGIGSTFIVRLPLAAPRDAGGSAR